MSNHDEAEDDVTPWCSNCGGPCRWPESDEVTQNLFNVARSYLAADLAERLVGDIFDRLAAGGYEITRIPITEEEREAMVAYSIDRDRRTTRNETY